MKYTTRRPKALKYAFSKKPYLKAQPRKAVSAIVRRAISSATEKKYFQIDGVEIRPIPLTLTNALAVTGGVFTSSAWLLNCPSQGNDENTRVGRAIRVKSCKFRLSICASNSTTPFANNNVDMMQVRVIMFRCKSPEGVSPYAADFMTGGTGAGLTRNLLPTVGKTNQIYLDKTYTFRPTGNIGNASSAQHVIRISKRFKRPFTTEFYPVAVATPGPQDIRTVMTNALCVVVIAGMTDATGVLSTTTLNDFQSQCVFEDA